MAESNGNAVSNSAEGEWLSVIDGIWKKISQNAIRNVWKMSNNGHSL